MYCVPSPAHSRGRQENGGRWSLLSENFLCTGGDKAAQERNECPTQETEESGVTLMGQAARTVRAKKGRSQHAGMGGQGMFPGGRGL